MLTLAGADKDQLDLLSLALLPEQNRQPVRAKLVLKSTLLAFLLDREVKLIRFFVEEAV